MEGFVSSQLLSNHRPYICLLNVEIYYNSSLNIKMHLCLNASSCWGKVKFVLLNQTNSRICWSSKYPALVCGKNLIYMYLSPFWSQRCALHYFIIRRLWFFDGDAWTPSKCGLACLNKLLREGMMSDSYLTSVIQNAPISQFHCTWR